MSDNASPIHKYRIKQWAEFVDKINSFCDKKNIPRGMTSFLSYKSSDEQPVPDCYTFFAAGSVPVELLALSRRLSLFREEMVSDFRNDSALDEDINRARMMAMANEELDRFARRVLGNDYIYSSRNAK